MKYYVKYQRRWYTKSQFTLPSPSPFSQNRKSGVDASFSFNFGLYRLMRRLSFTLRKKSFLRLSFPITSNSNNSPWWFVDVICSYTAVGFVLLVDGCRVKRVNRTSRLFGFSLYLFFYSCGLSRESINCD